MTLERAQGDLCWKHSFTSSSVLVLRLETGYQKMDLEEDKAMRNFASRGKWKEIFKAAKDKGKGVVHGWLLISVYIVECLRKALK